MAHGSSKNQKLSATIIIGGAVSATLGRAVGQTKRAFTDLGRTVRTLSKEQAQLGDSIKRMTASGQLIGDLRQRYERLGAQIERTKRAQDRLTAATQRHARLSGIGHGMMKAGATATVAGVGLTAAVTPGVREAKSWQGEAARIAALGLGEGTTREAQAFARELKTYGTSRVENLTLVRDALSVFTDMHHAEMATPILAKMKFANAAVYGNEHGAENEQKFLDMLKVIELRGGTKSKEAFGEQANMIQKVISATGGRVGADEWRHLISTGGLAAKSMRDDAFYYQLEPLVQEMGGDRVGTSLMSGYSSLYQGRTTKRALQNLEKYGLIGDRSKVKEDKAGQIAHLDVGAIKGAELFRKSQYEWMKEVLLPTLAKKGLTSKDQVLDAIGSIFSARKGADLMAAMYLQQQQIDKNEKMNRGAADIDQLDRIGRGTSAGKELELQQHLADLKLELGKNILPLYTGALEMANVALEKLNHFTEEHPKLASAMAIGIGGVGAALLVLGPVLTAGGALVTAYSSAQLLAATRAAAATTAVEANTVALAANGAAATTAAGGLAAFAKRAAIVIGMGAALDAGLGAFGVGGKKIDQAQDDANWSRMNWKQKVESGFARGVEGVGRTIFLGNIANEAQAGRIKAETDYLNKRGQGAAQPALPEPRAKAPVVFNDNSTNHFQVTQQPGENSDAFARRVAKQILDDQKRRANSVLFDRPAGQ